MSTTHGGGGRSGNDVGGPGMRPADIARLVEVGDPRVSPDGTRVAFVVTTVDAGVNEYRGRVWTVPVDGSGDPEPLTEDGGRHSRPRWSPDGSAIAFVSVKEQEDGEHSAIVCTLPAGGGEAREIAEWSDDVDDLVWSPDGRTVAFLARERDEERYGRKKAKDQPPRRITHLFSKLDNVGWVADRHRHLFVVPADGSAKPRLVTGGPFEDGGLTWSPDGTRLAFTSARHDDWDLTRAVDLFVVDVEPDGEGEGATPRRLTETVFAYSDPSWSPDGTRIAVVVTDERTSPRHSQIATIDVTTGERTVLTAALDRNCAAHGAHREPVWRGDELWFTVEDAGNAHLYRVPATGGRPEIVQGGDGWVTGYDVVGDAVAFTGTSPTLVSDLFARSALGGDEVRRLTRFSDEFLSTVTLAEPERFTAPSTGGVEVEAWILRPIGARAGERYPTLLNIHGGPFTQYGNRFFDEFQLQAGAGYAVVYANPRGSSGYSEAWGRAIRWPECEEDPGSAWGGVDHDDVLAVIDEAVRRFDFVDPDRLGVLGGSYGGYMTSWIAGHGGEQRFKAGVSERAVNDVLHLEHDSDIAGVFKEYVGVSHIDDPEPYRRQSPITYLHDMVMPLLILHSENDLRCPISQAEELFVALRMLKHDVEFVRFPGEGHELSRSGSPQHRMQRAEIILDYFDRKM